MNVQDILSKLSNINEMDPDKHDGSYELMRETIKAYETMNDLSGLDFNDLNLVYLMSVGTWRHGIPAKEKIIDKCNLPDNQKALILNKLHQIWDEAANGTYENTEEGNPSIGMFGTGFYSFAGKTDNPSTQAFIRLCIDITYMDDEEKIFERCEDVFNNEFKGMQAAAASQVLHCLKPMVFPILNTNSGYNNIYEQLGVKLENKGSIQTYIDNCRKIKAFRDSNFDIKNYRIFDIAARKINEDVPAEYYPSLNEYNPGISTEKWIELLEDDAVVIPEQLDLLTKILQLGGESTCAHIEEVYGGKQAAYNIHGSNLGKNVYKSTNCPLFKDAKGERYFPVPFIGRDVNENGMPRFSWKLREELKEALVTMGIDKVVVKKEKSDVETVSFDKNMILYGPPGTGKTYNTVNYAVAICDGLSYEAVCKKPYKEVYTRYKELKQEGRIAFTTFHQSYGYEEFIEGIKPVLNSDDESGDVAYKIKNGVFKEFCEEASKLTSDMKTILSNSQASIREDARLWSMILGGSGMPDLADNCYVEGTIRMGFTEYPERITADDDTGKDKARRMLLNFQDEMEIGDVVVSRSSATEIDGVAIITGEYEFEPREDGFNRKRNVEWIYKGEPINIYDLNGQTRLSRFTLCPLYRISVDDLLKRITGEEVIDETRPYVFIIDEINRGNISKIFGELITLIETTKRRGAEEAAEAILPYSNKAFSVPSNVHLLGTMNTADRSIALMDTALRRRFQFIEMMPDAEILRAIGADKVIENSMELDVAKMLEVVNKRIEYLYDREHTIGHAFFIGLKNEPTVAKLASIFRKSVLPLLQEYFYEDYSKIMMVLGDNGKTDDQHKFVRETKIESGKIFKGDSSDMDIPDYSYEIQDDAFEDINSYLEII